MSTYKYLDDNGLTYYNSKVQAKLNAKLGTSDTAYRTTSIPYGECDSTSTATAFTATVPGITALRDGVCMLLKNGVITSASGFTIDINGLGAKPVYSNMAAATRETTVFNVNYTILFVYDSDRVSGGCWVYYRGYYSDANTIGYQVRTNSSTLPAKQTGYRYRLWFTSADGQNYVPINTSSSTSTTGTKALNTTTPIDPFGAIVYNSTNGTVNADANLPTGTQWTQYVLDMRYQKYPLTLTYPDPVYLKCTPQSTGGALIDDIVQTLPTTEDGKIYIYLGTAYSATNMELKQNHPVYYYNDGAIRAYTNATAGGSSSVAWGGITGTLSDQTDLNTALAAKANSADLATVATSGSYNDLTNKPTIPTVNNATLTIQKNGSTVKTFTANASSNVTANITVPTKTSDLTNDSGYLTTVAWGDVTGKPTFATVATSGSYNDLSNKPTIPAAQVNSDWDAASGVAQILNKPTLATVATSGSYNDLSGKPTIPTAGTISSGSTGYATGGDVYTAIGNVETILSTLNNGGGAQ